MECLAVITSFCGNQTFSVVILSVKVLLCYVSIDGNPGDIHLLHLVLMLQRLFTLCQGLGPSKHATLKDIISFCI